MKRMIRHTMLSVVVAFAATTAAAADFADMTREQIRAEIKARCIEENAEYGESAVLFCMKDDWAGAQQVRAAIKSHSVIARRCLEENRDYGYSAVAFCVEDDIDASEAIANW